MCMYVMQLLLVFVFACVRARMCVFGYSRRRSQMEPEPEVKRPFKGTKARSEREKEER